MGEKYKKAVDGGEKKEGGGGAEKKEEVPSVVVLKADMHCEGCASKIKRSVKGFEEMEQNNKIMRFGDFMLQQFDESDKFAYNQRDNLDEMQLCLIDNIWNLPTNHNLNGRKKLIIGALTNYFQTMVQKPIGKKFLCYILFSDPKPGIYATWQEIKKQIDLAKKPSWKGSYNLQDAIDEIRAKVGSNYYISPSLTIYNGFRTIREAGAEKFSGSLKQSFEAFTQVIDDIHDLDTQISQKMDKRDKILDVASSSKSKDIKRPVQQYMPQNIINKVYWHIDKIRVEEFLIIQEFLKKIAREHYQTPGIYANSECYYNYEQKCKNSYPGCAEKKLGCPCQIKYLIFKAYLNIEYFIQAEYEKIIITPSKLLEYGVIGALWIGSFANTKIFGRKMASAVSYALTKSDLPVHIKIESSPPDWEGSEIEPARHLYRIHCNGLSTRYEDFKDAKRPEPKYNYEVSSQIPIKNQLDTWRAIVQGSDWFWNYASDNWDYFLVGETSTEKIYMDSLLGENYFGTFDFKTKNKELIDYYSSLKLNHEIPYWSYTQMTESNLSETAERNLDN